MDKIAQILLKANAIVLKTNPPFKWASGILSPIYTDNRLLMSYPKERDIIVDSFIEMIKKEKIKVDGFAGTATAGIAWAAWLSQKMQKPMVYVRSEAKSHGRQNQIEGKIEKGKNYIVVEDLISTGGSSIGTVNALKDAGAKVENCIAIFTYELQNSIENFKNASIKLNTLSNFTNLIKEAIGQKYISKDQYEKIMKWKKDPQNWKP